MIEPFRSDFNARFTQNKYQALIERLNRESRTAIEFRMAETPCFFEEALLREIVDTGIVLTQQLLGDPEYLLRAEAAIPDNYRMPGCGTRPHFMTADFGLVRDADGGISPKLVELQAFPSIFGFQPAFGRAYKEVFELDDRLRYLFGNLTDESYWSLLKQTIIGPHDPANVVLLEVDPLRQKTLPDFRLHEAHLGLRVVDVQDIVRQGNKLLYHDERRGGLLTPIHRIYNRVIVDEVVRKQIELPFDYRDELAVEWAGHPNWYFKISKFSIPYLHHPAVPKAVFLDQFFTDEGRSSLPAARDQLILKPLYSFAGKGIQFAPTESDLRAIPEAERANYLVQERVSFEPVIATPVDPTQAEIRILYVWPDGGELTPMTSLVRMGRGMMMGVDHNRDQAWVGGTAALYLPDAL